MENLNDQFNSQFDKASLLLNNCCEFKDKFTLLCVDSAGIYFATNDFNNHYLLPRKNKNILTSFDVEKITLIKQLTQ